MKILDKGLKINSNYANRGEALVNLVFITRKASYKLYMRCIYEGRNKNRVDNTYYFFFKLFACGISECSAFDLCIIMFV